MQNIRLNYLYRDYANYKNHGEAIFTNPNHICLADIQAVIDAKLIDGTWFYASQWHLPDLHFEKYDDEMDHALHEFGSIEQYTDEPTEPITIDEFMMYVKASSSSFLI